MTIDSEHNTYGRFHLLYARKPVNLPQLVQELFKVRVMKDKGRGGIRMLTLNNRRLISRLYRHGGIFRAFTRDLFLSNTRGLREIEILNHLSERGFPVVEPFCLIEERGILFSRLYLFTIYEENAVDFLSYLRGASQAKRMRLIKALATALWNLEHLGVYHPDLHIQNILVSEERGLVFLDFDKARMKEMTGKDMEKMLWRLNRYVEKMHAEGTITVSMKEKLLFLRMYKKLSQHNIISSMAKKLGRKEYMYRIGWYFEKLFYGGKK
ncbi:MAG TPA: hypothetical protein DDW17_07815 [Deltaproteobacteria bacterium]|nr:hypothetical protein [Deltaproteobacteria bacterium]